MSFSSVIFILFFLPIVILLTAVVKSGRIWILAAASFIFYLWSGALWALMLPLYGLMITLLIWLVSRALPEDRKLVFTAAVVLTLLPLVLFRYLVPAMGLTGLVPLGVSIFTFEALSVLIDSYREPGQLPTPGDVILYLGFFPTVTAGPIMRFDEFRRGLTGQTSWYGIQEGMCRFVGGLAKKTLIADKIAPLADLYFEGAAQGLKMSCPGFWIGSAAYTLQIYFDFSGYSDMAIGIGQMLGFYIPENFQQPYQASSLRGFWKRWHITLSNWFRDYVYIPLGGNRRGEMLTIRNMLIAWLLTGLWHGINMTFVLWGLGHCALLIFEKKKSNAAVWLTEKKRGYFYTLFCVNLLWIFFRAGSMTAAFRFLGGMTGIGAAGFALEQEAVRYLPVLLIAVVCCLPLQEVFSRIRDHKWYPVLRGAGLLVLLWFSLGALLSSNIREPFIYEGF